MRVFQLVTDRDRRGAQVFATDLAGGLTQLGHDVVTAALAPGRHDDSLDIDALGPTRTHPATLRAVRAFARQADVVIAHGSTTLPVCALALAGSGTPFVYRQISDPHFWAATPVKRLRTALALRRAAHIVTLSDQMADVFGDYYRVAAHRMTTIPNAVPADRFQPATDDERASARVRFGCRPDTVVVAYVGALVHEKGVDRLVCAASDLPHVELVVAGSGPELHPLTDLARAETPGRVHFVGNVGDVEQVYAAADLIALPSRAGDSMPAVLIEAGLAGIPALATDVGAVSAVIVDGATGVVCDNDDAEFATALRILCGDDDARSTLVEPARRHCQRHFTVAATAPAWSAMLTSHQRER